MKPEYRVSLGPVSFVLLILLPWLLGWAAIIAWLYGIIF